MQFLKWIVLSGFCALNCAPAWAQNPTRQQEVELNEYAMAYYRCGEIEGRDIATKEIDLAREDITPIAVARCSDLRGSLNAKVLEIEGPVMGPKMFEFDTINFRISVESAAAVERRRLGLPEL